MKLAAAIEEITETIADRPRNNPIYRACLRFRSSRRVEYGTFLAKRNAEREKRGARRYEEIGEREGEEERRRTRIRGTGGRTNEWMVELRGNRGACTNGELLFAGLLSRSVSVPSFVYSVRLRPASPSLRRSPLPPGLRFLPPYSSRPCPPARSASALLFL